MVSLGFADLVFFSFLFSTTALFHLESSLGKFGLLSPGKASCNRVAPPNLRCMPVVGVFPANSDMDYRIFSARTDVST